MSTAAQRVVVAHADLYTRRAVLSRLFMCFAGTVDKKAWLEAALETYGGLSASTDVSEDGDVTKLTVKQDSAKGMPCCRFSLSGHLWLVGATRVLYIFLSVL